MPELTAKRRLKDINVFEVSFVDKAANGQKFLLYKRFARDKAPVSEIMETKESIDTQDNEIPTNKSEGGEKVMTENEKVIEVIEDKEKIAKLVELNKPLDEIKKQEVITLAKELGVNPDDKEKMDKIQKLSEDNAIKNSDKPVTFDTPGLPIVEKVIAESEVIGLKKQLSERDGLIAEMQRSIEDLKKEIPIRNGLAVSTEKRSDIDPKSATNEATAKCEKIKTDPAYRDYVMKNEISGNPAEWGKRALDGMSGKLRVQE